MPAVFAAIFLVTLLLVGAATWAAYALFLAKPRQDMLRQLGADVRALSYDAPASPLLMDAERHRSGFTAWAASILTSIEARAASAGMDWSGAAVLLTSTGLAIAGALIGWIFPILIFRWISAPALALLLGSLPSVIINYRRAKRMSEFEGQFPEALDFIARSLRAGHAFTVSLEMLASESPEPLSLEFRRVFQELNLGAAIEPTLLGLAARVPLVDVKFFASAVLLQREAGGNLSEILTNLAHTVRERFRLRGHVRAATAHARISALVLTLLPLIVLVGLQIRSPQYVRVFATDPDGPYLLLGALFGQVTGYLLMRKLINFRI